MTRIVVPLEVAELVLREAQAHLSYVGFEGPGGSDPESVAAVKTFEAAVRAASDTTA